MVTTGHNPTLQAAVVQALQDFERTPGRFAVALREPQALFEQFYMVMLLATGRPLQGLPDEPAQEAALRQAARFFVRTVMLRPGTDHLTLLGLRPGFTPEQLRDHYRLMIRLTHPDFEAAGEAWPADAATRINLANDVLASPVKRAEYVASLQAQTHPAAALQPMPVAPLARTLRRPKAARAHGQPERGPWLSRRSKLALAAAGTVLTAGALVFMGPTGEQGSLSVRQVPEVAAPTLSAATALADLRPTPNEDEARAAANLAAALAAVTPAPETQAGPATPARPPRPREARVVATPAVLAQDSAGMTLTMETRLSMKAPPVAAVAASATVAPMATVSTVVAVAEPPAPAAPVAPAAEPPTRLTLSDVQPQLTNLLDSLSSGRGENLVQWVGRDWRKQPANGAFVHHFNRLLDGRRVVQLGTVRMAGKPVGHQLVVEGVVQLHMLDANDLAQTRELGLRAHFQGPEGQPVLTQLAATGLR